ncbi:hypothetical protein COV04_03760 [Candidatus Uhrbacteria bacterium CG10_big_fil_rev_8_21_14_0_10_48_11]|uniref:DUF304 domain-containing protein n=1 Tax=Candidatus Uhrbacteria bacterium CG10_big_fil_rev_8_21_14_0_10_48_11 TaxID=1975037 RepID=A0A2M8LE10_9BACT|nr:MAG: hypothetical protein COV04_03760 [Candidatus Uhrbacteria bacterium CG10_big_fil_rev_8_21_14_0_10_48_11]
MEQELPMAAHHLQKSVVPLIVRTSMTLLLVNVAYVAFLAFFFLSGLAFAPIVLTVFSLPALTIFLLQTVFILFLVIDWAKIDYYLTPDKIIMFRGIIAADEIICDVRPIRTMMLRQGWFAKACNYGTTILTLSPDVESKRKLALFGILYPKQRERVIRSYHEAYQRREEQRGSTELDEEARQHYLKVPRIIA